MSRPKIIVSFTRDDYDAIKRFTPEDPDLPDTFDEWRKLATNCITRLDAQGVAFKEVVIDSGGLAEYCKASGINPDTVGRDAYAVYVDRSGPYPAK